MAQVDLDRSKGFLSPVDLDGVAEAQGVGRLAPLIKKESPEPILEDLRNRR
jgi:hypothetical protein